MTMFRPEDGRRKTEDGRRKTEDGGRKTEDGGRKTEDGGRLDVAINRAVREMLDVEPPAGLRSRVLQRIEGADSRSGMASTFRWKFVWIAAPVAAAAILILAVIAPWRITGPAPGTGTTPQIAAVERPAVVDPVPPSVVVPPTSTRPVPPRPARPSTVADARPRVMVERTVIAATVPAADGVGIDPLAAIDPIRIAPVGSAAIEHREVVITPLAPIAQLQIAPLNTPAGRF